MYPSGPRWRGAARKGPVTVAADVFAAGAAGVLAGRLVGVLEAVAADPGGPVRQVPVVSEGERGQLLHGWNDTGTGGVVPAAVLVAGRVAAEPDAVAVVSGDECWTCAGL